MVAPFIGGNLHPIGGKIKSVFEDTKTRQNLFCCGTARHGHGKTTPVFDRGETASLFGIVISLSYLCIVMEMARNGHGNQPRQVSSKTQALTEIFGEVLLRKARQGKARICPFHNCGRFTVLFGIVIPLSYLCIVELKTNKN